MRKSYYNLNPSRAPYSIRVMLIMVALACCHLLAAQDIAVSGTVTDEDGETLIGATVLVKGTATGTTTEIDGSYRITVPADAVLLFSYTGYAPQEVAVDGQSNIDVTLSGSVLLEEVVVVGYGTMERANVTGSIVTVDTAASRVRGSPLESAERIHLVLLPEISTKRIRLSSLLMECPSSEETSPNLTPMILKVSIS